MMRRGPAIILGSALAIGALLAITDPALAQDTERERLRQWYRSLMQPDNPGVSCCGEGDGHIADKVEVVDGQVYAIITDTRPDEPLGRRHIPPGTRYLVPPHKITWKHGNPTGHTVIFISLSDQVLCYVQNGGA